MELRALRLPMVDVAALLLEQHQEAVPEIRVAREPVVNLDPMVRPVLEEHSLLS